MTLEEQISQRTEVPVIRYQPIDPEATFDRDIFAVHMDKLVNDLLKYNKKLLKDGNDEYTIAKISKDLFGERDLIFRQKDPTLFARNAIYQATDHGKKAVGYYVKNNLDEFIKRNDGQSLIQILLSGDTVLCKDGDEEYERIVKRVNELRDIQGISEDPGKMNDYVKKRVKGAPRCPRWLQRVYSSFGRTQEFSQYLFGSYASYAQNMAIKEFMTGDKEVDKEKIKRVLQHTLDISWKAFEKEERETGGDGDQEDIFEQSILPIYCGLANGIFETEYREHERDKDSAKYDREEERKKQGVKA